MSGLSVEIALAMVYSGTLGATKTKFEKSLAIPCGKKEEILSNFRNMITELNKPQKSILYIANKIFTKENVTLNPTYKKFLKSFFQSSISSIAMDRT